jgi:hypothetical protein
VILSVLQRRAGENETPLGILLRCGSRLTFAIQSEMFPSRNLCFLSNEGRAVVHAFLHSRPSSRALTRARSLVFGPSLRRRHSMRVPKISTPQSPRSCASTSSSNFSARGWTAVPVVPSSRITLTLVSLPTVSNIRLPTITSCIPVTTPDRPTANLHSNSNSHNTNSRNSHSHSHSRNSRSPRNRRRSRMPRLSYPCPTRLLLPAPAKPAAATRFQLLWEEEVPQATPGHRHRNTGSALLVPATLPKEAWTDPATLSHRSCRNVI